MTTAIAKKQNGQPSVGFGNVVDNIFQNSLRHFFDDNFWSMGAGRNMVPVNVRETEKQYELDLVSPGFKKEDFSISVSDNMLTISNEEKEERRSHEKVKWVRNEYTLPTFSRTFTLDDTVNITAISATYADGILRLVLPKNEKAQQLSRTIEIK